MQHSRLTQGGRCAHTGARPLPRPGLPDTPCTPSPTPKSCQTWRPRGMDGQSRMKRRVSKVTHVDKVHAVSNRQIKNHEVRVLGAPVVHVIISSYPSLTSVERYASCPRLLSSSWAAAWRSSSYSLRLMPSTPSERTILNKDGHDHEETQQRAAQDGTGQNRVG